jgi:hypothetical protein
MRLGAPADLSAQNAHAGEKRGGIAAHKYEGLTSFQRTIPRRKNCGVAAVCGDITARESACAGAKGVKVR